MAVVFCFQDDVKGQMNPEAQYDRLVSLYHEFLDFQRPVVNDGVPDYTRDAMEAQQRGLLNYQKRLSEVDTSHWSVSRQVDYRLVGAAMHGLEFYHRVIRPWSRDPGFYTFIPFDPYPTIDGALDGLPELPLSREGVADLRFKLHAIPDILEQARGNLTEGSADLALLAIRSKEKESLVFQEFIDELENYHPALVADAQRARTAIDAYVLWLKRNKDAMTASAGVGKENYDWWLKHVQLLPYTWDECMILAQREYQRAMAFLRLEEHKNRNRPPLKVVSTESEYNDLYNQTEAYLIRFLEEEGIFTLPDGFEPLGPGTLLVAWDGPERKSPFKGFFQQCEDRDLFAQLCHNLAGHYMDDVRYKNSHHPIRSNVKRYGIDHIRAEAVATGLEEMMMQAGLQDHRPLGKEITYIMLAYRAVRAMGDLKLHNNIFNVEETVAHDAEWSPRGWASKEDHLIWGHLQITPRQPGYETGYLIGKVQLEKLLADRSNQIGDQFQLQTFMDDFFAAGMIPMALIRWEMTGLTDEIEKLR